MLSATVLERLFRGAWRDAALALRTLLLLSMMLFAVQPAGATAVRHAMISHDAEIGFSGGCAPASHAEPASIDAVGSCQPAGEQPTCLYCSPVTCASAPMTVAAAATARPSQRHVRHVFYAPAAFLSAHALPPELGPPRT